MLHIVNKLPIQHAILNSIHSGDTIILQNNAVYAAKQGYLQENLTQSRFDHLNLCVDKADLLRRNISNRELMRGVAVIDSLDEYQEYLAQDIAVKSCN